MVNIGPQWKGDLSAHFIADVSQPRHEAKALAARLIRATAYAMKGGAKDVSFRVPADPLIASVQSASLLRLAQELQPETLHLERWLDDIGAVCEYLQRRYPELPVLEC